MPVICVAVMFTDIDSKLNIFGLWTSNKQTNQLIENIINKSILSAKS